MEAISQRNIDEVCRILMTDVKTEEAKKLAGILKKANIISALYVFTYLKVIDAARTESMVLDESSEISKKYKHKKDDFDGFLEKIKQNYQLELHYLIDTPEKFKGAMSLLYEAIERQHLICDFDDGVHPATKVGKCEEDSHSDEFDTNPKDQTLHLTYSYSEDNHKMDKRNPIYICDKCQDSINSNSDGYVSCDTEAPE